MSSLNHSARTSTSQEISTLTQTCIRIISQFILNIITEKQNQLQLQFDLIFNFIFDHNQHQPKITSEQFKPIIQSILTTINHNQNSHHHHQLPFPLYASILKTYQDLTIFDLQNTSNLNRLPYSDLVLKDETKFNILFNLNPNPTLPLNLLTILNLSWYTTFSDQDLNIIHSSLKHSLIILRLDYTSITDLGIFNLSREVNLNKLEPFGSGLEENDLNYLRMDERSNWNKLTVLSLKGLKLITDKALVYLSRFPNLGIIDLNSTSCTLASCQILNKSIMKTYQKLHPHPPSTSHSSVVLKQFHHPTSKFQLDFFSGQFTLSEKFFRFMKWLEPDGFDDHRYEVFQINWIDQDDRPTNRFQSTYQSAKLHEHKSFFHKSIQLKPLDTLIDPSLCLIIDYPFKSIQLNHTEVSETTSRHVDHQVKVKRNLKALDRLGLDDDLSLLESYKSKKTKTIHHP
ncbi:uncharacterized protein MELLADRAFT_101637 [Melampsora larici-populina 98AG31]|uniref:Uncharacterized protein n=1 Tax=Melampsora larici-populina (strain 98AG31 / pathotype 3-4-7) TaxID=747676 RepID=F4R6H4_MELLP|nr:uncharacterized protein MELLADRAFT_101637 [Melampsora larici-populina 98AG31]EGG11880.1 hypothetical protein MELLADRAFT_101637 [Melampsora larici-populina 98AG31]